VTLDRASRMKSTLRFKISSIGFFATVKKPKVNLLSVDLNIGLPLLAVSTPHAKISRRIGPSRLALILGVFRACYVAKVAKTVIVSNAVGVVNKMLRPNSMHIEPSQSVHQVWVSVNPCKQVTFCVDCANNPANIMDLVSRISCKYPGFLVVGKKLSQSFNSQRTAWRFFWLRLVGKVKEIIKPVVPVVAVPVSYLLRAVSVGIEPRQAVRVVCHAINRDVNISGIASRACDTSNAGHAALYAPSKNAGLGIVIKKFLESILSQGRIVVSHAVVLLKRWFGQRPVSASTLLGLRHFNTEITI